MAQHTIIKFKKYRLKNRKHKMFTYSKIKRSRAFLKIALNVFTQKENLLHNENTNYWIDRCLICHIEVNGSQLCGKRVCNNRINKMTN
jgi:hypothetical protein